MESTVLLIWAVTAGLIGLVRFGRRPDATLPEAGAPEAQGGRMEAEA